MLVPAAVGFAFGFIGSIPVAGPIAALVLHKGLDAKFRSGFNVAIGAAVAEGMYACLTFWGFGALLAPYPWITPVSSVVAGAILIGLGVVFLRPRKVTAASDPPPPNKKHVGSAVLGFAITAGNPTLLATWTAAVTFLSALQIVDFTESGAPITFGSGVVIGIIAWFALLLTLIARFRSKFGVKRMLVVRRATGILCLSIAMWFVIRAVHFWLA